MTISDLFYKNAANTPDKAAIICNGEMLTYAQIEILVNKIINRLVRDEVKYLDHIGVLLPNEISFVALMIAAARLGVTLVPLSPALPESLVSKAFDAADVKHIIAHRNILSGINRINFSKADGHWIAIEELEDEPEETVKIECPNITGDEIFILTLTSGSTGEPKPIALTQKNKLDRAFAAAELYAVTGDDVILAGTPLYHSLAERLVLMPLLLGGTSVLMVHFTPLIWLKCIEEHKVTFSIAVSSQLAQIAEVLVSPFVPELSSLRCIVSSSALLEPHIKQELLNKLKCDFHECYGTSEVAIATSINFSESQRKYKSVGHNAPGVHVKIVSDDGRELSKGEVGEILVKTPMMFGGGYYKLPEMTQESISDGYFKTGDLGYIDDEGYLYYVNRKKDLIITGAVNVYPIDVENVVTQLPFVKECVALAYPDTRLGEIIAVAVVPIDNENFDMRKARFHCAQYLADYQQPRKYFILEKLPRNHMGKIDKKTLIEMLLNESE